MKYALVFATPARDDLSRLKHDPSLMKRFKAVVKALELLQNNPRYPSLQTHKFSALSGPAGEDVFEAYAENNTPGAYRIFFYYGPLRGEMTIVAILPHPK